MCSVQRASCSVIAAHTCERDGRAASLEYHISIFHSRSVRGMLRQRTDSIIAPPFCSDLSKKLTSSPGVSHSSFLLRYLRMVYEELQFCVRLCLRIPAQIWGCSMMSIQPNVHIHNLLEIC